MKRKLFFSIMFCIFSFSVVNAQTGSPWIKKIYNTLYMRDPTAWEYNKYNYNNGMWNTYDEILEYVKQYNNFLKSNNFSVTCTNLGNGQTVATIYQSGKKAFVDLISQDGGSIVASGAGNIVASGAGNIVTNATGNMQNLPGVTFGLNYGTLAAGTRRMPVSGKGAWIIK